MFDRNGHVALTDETIPQHLSNPRMHMVTSHVVLHRERELRLEREMIADDDMDLEEEMGVSSMRETSMRRVRQVGARDDDDTLLMLPRVASVSFSNAEAEVNSTSAEPKSKRVRQLPRVSALMPMRASPRPAVMSGVSPVSSAGQSSSLGSYRSQQTEEQADDDEFESTDDELFDGERDYTWDVDDGPERRMLCRLPTGLSNKDVEKEMERAVVEIASDGDSDADDAKLVSMEHKTVDADVKVRARSDVHDLISGRVDPFSRRASSSVQPRHDMLEEEGEGRPLAGTETARYQGPQEFAMFEDDYLSFQGFNVKSTGERSHYQGMASLLRSKRISSVTDSHSEDSDEATTVRTTSSIDSRRSKGRAALLGLRMRRNVEEE